MDFFVENENTIIFFVVVFFVLCVQYFIVFIDIRTKGACVTELLYEIFQIFYFFSEKSFFFLVYTILNCLNNDEHI